MDEEEVIIIESTVILKKIKYKGIFWVPEVKKTKSTHVGNVKRPYIVKWVERKQVGDVFTKDDFYKEYPKHEKDASCKRRVDGAIQNMILDGCITVHDNVPGKYRVLK